MTMIDLKSPLGTLAILLPLERAQAIHRVRNVWLGWREDESEESQDIQGTSTKVTILLLVSRARSGDGEMDFLLGACITSVYKGSASGRKSSILPEDLWLAGPPVSGASLGGHLDFGQALFIMRESSNTCFLAQNRILAFNQVGLQGVPTTF
jgi:hypothetical protein